MAVLYPRRALFSPQFQRAVETVFDECDLDGDGTWCADDLNALWMRVYGRVASEQERDELRRQAAAALADAIGPEAAGTPGPALSSDNGADRVVTVEAFRAWLCLLAETGRSSAAWAIMRAFGFDGRLERVS